MSKLVNCSLCTILYCTPHLAHIICKCDTLHLFHFLFSPVFERDYHFFTFPLQLIGDASTTTTPVSTTTWIPCYIVYNTKKQIIMHKCVCFRIKCFFVKLGCCRRDIFCRFVVSRFDQVCDKYMHKKLLSISCGIIVRNLFGWCININQSMHSIDGY